MWINVEKPIKCFLLSHSFSNCLFAVSTQLLFSFIIQVNTNLILIESGRKKTSLLAFVNNKGEDQPAQSEQYLGKFLLIFGYSAPK